MVVEVWWWCGGGGGGGGVVVLWWSVWFDTQPIDKASPERWLWRSIAELFLINNEKLMTCSSEKYFTIPVE